MGEQPERVRRAAGQLLLTRLVRAVVPGHPHSDSRSGRGFDFRARLEGGLAALLVLGVEREEGAVVRTHDDRVMSKGARRRPCRRVGVVRGRVTHDVLKRDFRPPLAFEV